MKTSWWIGVFVLFVIAQITSNTIEASTTGSEMATMQGVFAVEGADFSNPISAIVSIFTVPWHWIENLFGVLFFDYPSVFYGDWQWFRMVILWPLSLAIIITTVIAVVRGTSST